ncbi:FG-GAP-like repeat-containing protein [Myxococcota bacterium]|nr:FG-GAP-like repeat-containing protein [Myxococcota bacterium]
MFRPSRAGAAPLGLLLLASLASLTSCKKSEGEVCINDRSCGVGRRCEEVQRGQPKICVTCDAEEIAYDGLDNDCNTRTPDADLDGDGENAKTASVRPGLDCDDNDPLISSRAAELCGDRKDNNCDDRVDEEECGDRTPPSVSIVSPVTGDLVAGIVEVEVLASDDVRVVELALSINGISLETTSQASYVFSVDTSIYPDGELTLQVDATDLADRRARSEVTVTLDNATPPLVGVVSPVDGASHSGDLVLEATASDAAGIDNVAVTIDSGAPIVLTAAPYTTTIDTDLLGEGQHTATFVATDRNANTALARATFFVDRTGPAVEIGVTPINGTAVSGVFTVIVSATDPADIDEITGAAGGFVDTSPTSPLSFSIDSMSPPRLPNGPYHITATARDGTIVDGVEGLGNVSTVTATVVIDNIPPEPVVELVNPQDGWGVFQLMDLAATVTSPVNNNITSVEFFVNGESVYLDNTAPYATQFDFTGFVGTATVSVTAIDSQLYTTTETAVVRVVPPPQFRLANVARGQGSVGPTGYAIGDVTEDGIPDALTCGTDLGVLTGTISASGVFSFLPAERVGPACVSVRLANVDIDPALDVIALSGTTLDVYTNLGHGAFAPPVSSNTSVATPNDFELGDLNGDGQVDVVIGMTAGGSGDIRVFLQANGLFPAASARTYGVVGNITDVTLANVDGDPDLDVALSRAGSTVASVYRNNGSGVFGSAQDSFTSVPTTQVRVADVNGDAYPDLVVLAPTIDAIEVLTGNPVAPGDFTLLGSFAIDNPSGLHLEDMDGDADLDFLITSGDNNVVTLFENRNTAATIDAPFVRGYVFGRDVARPSLVDLDGDALPELVASSATEGGVMYAKNLGPYRFRAAELVVGFYPMRGVASGDLIGNDGRPDLAVISAAPTTPQGALASVTLFENTASGGFELHSIMSLTEGMSQPQGIAIGDLDGLLGLDIAVGSNATPTAQRTDSAALFLSTGDGTFAPPTSLSVERPYSVAIGDVDNDGVSEAVFSQDYTATAVQDGSAVFEGTGGAPRFTLDEGFGASSVAIGSLDNDPLGRLDFAVANSVTNDVTVNLWNGTDFTTVTFNALAGISAITIGRVGEDDVNDIVGVSTQGGVIIMEGDPSFGFSSPVLWPAGVSPTGVIGGDFNEDGLYDVLVMNPQSDAVTLLVASPQGGFFRPVTVPSITNPQGFVAGDFDGDGRDDLAVASGGAPALMLIYNDGDRL